MTPGDYNDLDRVLEAVASELVDASVEPQILSTYQAAGTPSRQLSSSRHLRILHLRADQHR
jgi:hypothetical protein